ncbi:hypothetical protein RPPX_12160 [Pseudomonas putida S12]|uniref:Uncharacterized protein n=2 Tax=Pseudomonas putida TaxID=303 RepID=A0AA34WRC8_PSEPU|nr:hypothetical protein [Pseudomonas putida]AJA14068.1 hypothetical protein RPPX_12160 [Pseudomonas putida S12]
MMITTLTDPEIYELAHTVLSQITDEINDEHYAPSGGLLSLSWSTAPGFNAWAESDTIEGGPPQHKIVLHYELARLLYRDAEGFCKFVSEKHTQEWLKDVFKYTTYPNLPEIFTLEDCVRNMFFASLTWVYFHELGHLAQEHGFVRKASRSDPVQRIIQELDASGASPLTGRAAEISHVTELAADFEATTHCLIEMARQFLQGPLVSDEEGADLFVAGVYLLACSMSCIFYRFNNGRCISSKLPIVGSHPHPVYRLEINVPHAYEFAEMIINGASFKADRRELVIKTKQAADLGALYHNYFMNGWNSDYTNLFVKGLPQRPEFRAYSQRLIDLWDEILPEIVDRRHFGTQFGLLRFTTQYREILEMHKAIESNSSSPET